MSQADNSLVDSIRQMVLHLLNSKTTEIPDSHMLAQFVSVEAFDSNLSTIRMPDGSQARGVPKSSSVGSLTSGDSILVATPRSGPAVIICRVVGKFSTFSV